MARKVSALPPPKALGKYPWEDWLDGDVWELIPGEDFEISTDNFRTAVYSAASNRNLKATVRTALGKVYLQAIPNA